MSGITLEQAQAELDALLSMQSSNMLSMSVGGRTYTFRTARDRLEQIIFWQRQVTSLQRSAAGASRHGVAVADLSSSR